MNSETRHCKYEPCSKESVPTHARQIFCEPTCRANQHYVDNPEKGRVLQGGALRSVATHPLDDARGQVEEGRTSAEWALIAREHTMRTLLETGYFTADDLEPLGIPAIYRRSVHGLVTAYFRNEGFTEEAGRRKSERPERKGGKNTVFRATAKARRELPKLLTDLQKEIAGVHADDGTSPGVSGLSPGGDASRSFSVDSGEAGRPGPGSGAGEETSKEPPGPEEAPKAGTASPAPLSLLPDPDPESWAA